MGRRQTLEDDVSAVFARACRERDWVVAEFLFQALEAIAQREDDERRVEAAFGELLENMHSRPHH